MSNSTLVLIDTSSWIENFRKDGLSEVRERVRKIFLTGNAAWCEIIQLELWNGARGTGERKLLEELEKDVTLLSITPEVWKESFALASQLRTRGISIPTTDILIAACARYHRVPLESCDKHFKLLPEH